MHSTTEFMDPQRVPAKVMQTLPPMEREQVIFCLQGFYPLPGDLAQKVREAVERKEKQDGK